MGIIGRKTLSIRDKLIIVLVNTVLIVSIKKGDYTALAIFGLISVSIMVVLRPDYRRLPSRVAVVFLYPLFVSVFIPFASEGKAVARLDSGLFVITVTDNGLTTFYTVLIKAFLSILILSSLVLSADEMEIFHGLSRLKVPKIIVSIIFLMYRYIFLIKEDN